MNIICFDPSITAFGVAIMNSDGKFVYGECIRTSPASKALKLRKGDDRCARISIIVKRILELNDTYNPGLIVSEQPTGSQSAIASLCQGACLALVQTLSDALGISVEWFHEGDCKKSLHGRRDVSKDEVIQKIVSKYKYSPMGIKTNDEAICDAVQVFHCFSKTSETMKLLKFNKVLENCWK